MKQWSALELLLVALVTLYPMVAVANSGDFSGGVAIGSSYAGVDTAPTNGIIVQGSVGIGTTSPVTQLEVNGTGQFDNGTNTPNLNGGQLAGLRNRAINGDMRIDQRNQGASQTITSTAAYTVDRFYASSTGANSTGQRVSGSGADQYLYQFTGAASVTGIAFGQKFEATNVYDLAGTTATFSVELANSLLTTVTWTAYYPGSADNWGSRTSIASGTFTVNSTLTKYSTTISLPSNVQNGLEIELTVGAQTSGTWKIGEFQLENGSTPTAFERLPLGLELPLAQRYYVKLQPSYGPYCLFAVAFGNSTTQISALVPLPVLMRATPTMTTSAMSTFVLGGGAGQAFSSLSLADYVPTGVRIDGNMATAVTVGAGYGFGCNNSTSTYMAFSAEL